MIVLITGSTGFIGRNLVELMTSKYKVLAPPRQQMDLLDGDSVSRFFRQHQIDVVIHSATTPGHRNAPKVTDLVARDLRMFFNLVHNADKFGKMIFLGSGAVYDARYYQPKMNEECFDTHIPVDEVGFSKYICSKYIERTDRIVELRLFGVFGKYEDYEIRFISNAICKTLFDLPITIKKNRRFDYLYVSDLIPVIDYFIENTGQFKSYNVTPDTSIELLTLAEIVRGRSGKNLPIIVAQDGMGIEYSGDNARLRQEIRNLTFTAIDNAIEQLYSWYARNRHLLKRELLLADK